MGWVLRQFICAIFLIASTSVALANGWILEKSWVEDPEGNLTLLQVKDAPQKDFASEFFGQGFSDSAFWIRLRIAAKTSPAGETLVVRIRPPFIDEVQIYDPLEPSVRATGSIYPWSRDEFRSLNLNFKIPVGDAPRDVWLRLKTSKSTLMLVEVVPLSDAIALDRHQELIFMFYLAVLFTCMGWGVLNWLETRDRLIGAYVIRELFTVIYASAVLGYNRMFFSDMLPSLWFERINDILILLPISVFMWFDYYFLRRFKPKKWLLLLMAIVPSVIIIESALILTGYEPIAFRIASAFVAVAITLILLTVYSTSSFNDSDDVDAKPVISKFGLRATYTISLGIALFYRLAHMGVTDGSGPVLYLQLVYPMLTSIAIMILLQVRATRLKYRQAEAALRLAVVERDAVNERSKHEEQTNFLRMLTHELKTPLSVLRLIVDRSLSNNKLGAHATEAISEINAIITRCIAVDKSDSVGITLRLSEVDVNEVVRRCIQLSTIKDRTVMELSPSLLVLSDFDCLRTVIDNLIDNARKYAPPNSLVEVETVLTARDGCDVWCFTIKNQIGRSGCPDSARVFEKYYRHENATHQTGSGLGLYLIKSLVQKMGGSVFFTPESNQIVFGFCLPVRPKTHQSS